MKAILEFNLDNKEDQYAHMQCVKALDMSHVLYEMGMYFRDRLKYGGLSPERFEELEKAREKLHSLLELHNITLE